MPNYRRAKTKGGTFFFTVTTLGRQPILTADDVRQSLREGIDIARTSWPFTIDAWVLLPDHLHCIWVLPEDDANFSSRWAIIKRHVSKRCRNRQDLVSPISDSRKKRKEIGLWQRRFWEHRIRDDAEYARCVDYIHWNPIKHGYVDKPADWPYSTFHKFVEMGIYSSDWGGIDVHPEDDKEYGE